MTNVDPTAPPGMSHPIPQETVAPVVVEDVKEEAKVEKVEDPEPEKIEETKDVVDVKEEITENEETVEPKIKEVKSKTTKK